jgi:hypothetical protein
MQSGRVVLHEGEPDVDLRVRRGRAGGHKPVRRGVAALVEVAQMGAAAWDDAERVCRCEEGERKEEGRGGEHDGRLVFVKKRSLRRRRVVRKP